MILTILIIGTLLSRKWGKELAIEALRAGATDRRKARGRIAFSVLLRITVLVPVIATPFGFGLTSADEAPEVFAKVVLSWMFLLPLSIGAYSLGINAAFRDQKPKKFTQENVLQHYYDSVAQEISRRDIKPGLWARAVAETGEEGAAARAAYIRFRVDEIRAAAHDERRASK